MAMTANQALKLAAELNMKNYDVTVRWPDEDETFGIDIEANSTEEALSTARARGFVAISATEEV